jgi:hypothetical protein
VFAENVVQRWRKGGAKSAVKEIKRLSAGKSETPKKQTEQVTKKQTDTDKRRDRLLSPGFEPTA